MLSKICLIVLDGIIHIAEIRKTAIGVRIGEINPSKRAIMAKDMQISGFLSVKLLAILESFPLHLIKQYWRIVNVTMAVKNTTPCRNAGTKLLKFFPIQVVTNGNKEMENKFSILAHNACLLILSEIFNKLWWFTQYIAKMKKLNP